jgi:hypothetical protein
LALFPLAVARIQRVILELVRGEVLSLDAPRWDLMVLDRDGLAGCGVVAAKDFQHWLGSIWAIYQPDRRVPTIQVHEIQHNQPCLSPLGRADVLLDVSVQLGTNQRKALKFHGILANLLSRKAYRRFSISQILAAFRCGFLRTYNPTESTFPYELERLRRMSISLLRSHSFTENLSCL